MLFNQVVSIGKKTDGRVYVSVSLNGRRQRFSSGEVIGQDIQPNRFSGSRRFDEARALEAAFILAIRQGWAPEPPSKEVKPKREKNVIVILRASVKHKLSSDYSRHYKNDIVYITKQFEEYLIQKNYTELNIENLTTTVIRDYLDSRTVSARSKRNIKAYLSTVFASSIEDLGLKSPFKDIRLPRTTEVLHKPFTDVQAVLEEIYKYDQRLHLCCLLAYGCLLRPHREIRELTWGDFNEDLTVISLSGKRNKGKCNRIVPVAAYVRERLVDFRNDSESGNVNIFTGTPSAYNVDFFKTLWGRYKKCSTLLKPNQTMYSFRHGGALKVFEQTGSLVKLQQVMGHSSLQVSLTYLRGLEVKQLDVSDMPIFP